MSSDAPVAVVLAAGKGVRMKSDLPKVLVEAGGRPMIDYVLDALDASGVGRTIAVVGYRAELVRSALAGRDGVEFALQEEQLGTGHAVMACRELLDAHDGAVVVLAGDQPMTQASSIAALLAEYEREPSGCLLGTLHKKDPTGLGRILRDAKGDFAGIVEEKDATEEQRRITEVNLSYYVFHWGDLLSVLEQIRADNAQGEYYITDAPALLLAQGKRVRALDVLQPCEALSVNTADELAVVEETMQQMNPTTQGKP